MPTKENLSAAFAGESQANHKYVAFAQKAEKDGFPQVAKLFRAAAEAETIHAVAHFRVMGGIKTTVENLQAAMSGESYEFTKMYPEFVETAKKEKVAPAEKTFKNAMDVEKLHYNLYEEALKAIQSGKDLAPKSIYICDICGNTVVGGAPDTCAICGAKKDRFVEIK